MRLSPHTAQAGRSQVYDLTGSCSCRFKSLDNSSRHPTHHLRDRMPIDTIPRAGRVFRSSLMKEIHLLVLPVVVFFMLSFSVTTMWKSARFREGQSLTPYASHYRTSFASSTLPYPHPHRLSLRIAFPEKKFRIPREKYGLTAFHTSPSRMKKMISRLVLFTE